MYRYQTSATIVNLMRFTVAFLCLGWASFLTMKSITLWNEMTSPPKCAAVDTRTLADLHLPFKGTLP